MSYLRYLCCLVYQHCDFMFHWWFFCYHRYAFVLYCCLHFYLSALWYHVSLGLLSLSTLRFHASFVLSYLTTLWWYASLVLFTSIVIYCFTGVLFINIVISCFTGLFLSSLLFYVSLVFCLLTLWFHVSLGCFYYHYYFMFH